MKTKKKPTASEILEKLTDVLNETNPSIIDAYGAACAFVETVRQQYIFHLHDSYRKAKEEKGGAA